MQRSRTQGGKRAGIVLLTIFLASVRVDCWCVEKDCVRNKSIRVENATTGECITCFPCLVCEDGLPSVPCGSTIPFGTHIDCGGPVYEDPSITPSPSTSGILTSLQLTTSSVTLPHSSHLKSSLPVITSKPSMAVHLNSYAIHTGTNLSPEKTTNKPGFPSEKLQKQHHSTSICTFKVIGSVIGAVLFCGVVVILCRRWKRKRTQEDKHLDLSANKSPSQQTSCITLSDPDNGTCAVYPSTDSATFSRDLPRKKIGKQQNQPDEFKVYTDLKEGNGGNQVTIPLSLDIAPTEGDQDSNVVCQESDDDLVDLSPDTPFIPQQRGKRTKVPQATVQLNILVNNSCPSTVPQPHNQLHSHSLDVWSENAVKSSQRMCTVDWPALSQEEKYLTKLLEVPSPLLQNICLSLDMERIDCQDVRSLADYFGVRFAVLQQAAKNAGESPTLRLLKEKFNGTVGDFAAIMKLMERDDIITEINEWHG